MPKIKKSSTTHHCPLAGQNCRPHNKHTYCKAHQEYCQKHDLAHLKDEACVSCEVELVACTVHQDVIYNKHASCHACDKERECCLKRSERCHYTTRNTQTYWYCGSHQYVCNYHPDRLYMKYERCHRCQAAEVCDRLAADCSYDPDWDLCGTHQWWCDRHGPMYKGERCGCEVEA